MVRLHVHVNVYALYVLLLVEEILDWSGRDGDNMMAALIINESFGIELEKWMKIFAKKFANQSTPLTFSL